METEEAAESQRNKATPPLPLPLESCVKSPPASFQKLAGLLADSLESNYSKDNKKKKTAFESFSSFSGARLNSAVMSANCIHATRKVKRLCKETQT